MSQRMAFVLSSLLAAAALVGATATAPVRPAASDQQQWKTEHVRASGTRRDYWMTYVALQGRDANRRRDTLARAEIVCQTDSGARMLIGVLPEKPLSDTVAGQASYFTTVRAHVVSSRPFLRLLPPASRLEGDWPYRALRNSAGWLVIRTGLPVRRLADGMRDDRRLRLDFADGRVMSFPLFGADTATASVLSRCVDL